jgi:hypothetical protein
MSQESFSWLSIPDPQHIGFMQESLDQCDFEPPFRSGSTGSLKSDTVAEQQPSYTTVNYISNEARALITAYEDAVARRSQALTSIGGNVQCHELKFPSSTDTYEPERILVSPAPPPKRFFRTFWQSLTIRMLRLEKKKIKSHCEDQDD